MPRGRFLFLLSSVMVAGDYASRLLGSPGTLVGMRQILIAATVIFLIVAACSAESNPPPSPSTSSTTAPAATNDVPDPPAAVLLAGTVEIPGAGAFEDPGFHEVVILSGVLPDAASGLSGQLTVSLMDVGRPEQTCDRDHPLSGCVTVDWSDFEGRPGVPGGGVFDNHLNLVSASGPVEFFLSETNGLASTPDSYSPT
jgi:hypothetical protein